MRYINTVMLNSGRQVMIDTTSYSVEEIERLKKQLQSTIKTLHTPLSYLFPETPGITRYHLCSHHYHGGLIIVISALDDKYKRNKTISERMLIPICTCGFAPTEESSREIWSMLSSKFYREYHRSHGASPLESPGLISMLHAYGALNFYSKTTILSEMIGILGVAWLEMAEFEDVGIFIH